MCDWKGKEKFVKARWRPSALMLSAIGNAASFISLCMCIGVAVTLNKLVAHAYYSTVLQGVAYSVMEDDPKTLDKALSRRDRAAWWDCVMLEWQSFIDQGVFEEADLPPGRRTIDTKIVLKLKRDTLNIPLKYKTRIVARGFQQELGVDFFESFSAMSHLVSVRALLALAASKGWVTNQIDVQTAYLYGDIEEEIYLSPPKGLEGMIPPGKVMHLRKGVYGLSQSSRSFYKLLIKTLKEFGMEPCTEDECIWKMKHDNGSELMVATVWMT
mmetsp:Transcript_46512/g.95135  ORF Transcript_46512/g.95135 Transcript_46512/m.95135 type:complete len:270 (-) Transcript_46512:198-1007(-)